MRYFGSKAALVAKVQGIISRFSDGGTFCDPFGGIGCVGSHFKAAGYRVISGDVLTFAHLFQISRIVLNRIPSFRKLRLYLGLEKTSDVIRHLSASRSRDGWFTEEYARKRRFFTLPNARAIESCWETLHEWSRRDLLTRTERALLLSSLIDSADRVANTAGTYYAYLKSWHRKALRPFEFTLLTPVPGTVRCASYKKDARILVKEVAADVLYLDPPYNARSHAHYYHLPETLARMAKPRVHGMAGIPANLPAVSAFNRRADAADALADVIREAKAPVVVVHYASSGLISETQIRALLSPYGVRSRHVISAPGYTTQHQSRLTHHIIHVAATHG